MNTKLSCMIFSMMLLMVGYGSILMALPAAADDATVELTAGVSNGGTLSALSWPASKKRQGTNSWEVWHRLDSRRHRDLMSGRP